MLQRLRAMALLLLEHASSYTQLGAQAAAEYRRAWTRRLVLLAAGLMAAATGVGALWAAGLVAVWETPWRLAYAIGTAMALLLAAGACLYGAIARREPGPSAGVLRSELLKDKELFQQWKATL